MAEVTICIHIREIKFRKLMLFLATFCLYLKCSHFSPLLGEPFIDLAEICCVVIFFWGGRVKKDKQKPGTGYTDQVVWRNWCKKRGKESW